MRRFLTYILLPFLVFSLTIPSALAAVDKKEIEAIVKKYIEEHPGEILDAIVKYQQKKRVEDEKKQMEQSFRQRFNVPLKGSPIKGEKSAQITVVEFSDFLCPYCARVVPTLAQLEKKYGKNIKFSFKHFPLENIHPLARDASRASMAAGEQGKFWEYHDTLMAMQREWNGPQKDKMFEKYAKSLKLDMDKFKKDLAANKDKYNKQIDADLAHGNKLGVSSTPTLFVNGVKVSGARPLGFFSNIIDRLIAEKKGPSAPPQSKK